MKKKSRFLTGLLSAVMALSLCALPVSAEGNKVLTIPDWENKKGSITTSMTMTPLRVMVLVMMVRKRQRAIRPKILWMV